MKNYAAAPDFSDAFRAPSSSVVSLHVDRLEALLRLIHFAFAFSSSAFFFALA